MSAAERLDGSAFRAIHERFAFAAEGPIDVTFWGGASAPTTSRRAGRGRRVAREHPGPGATSP